ncbi:DDE-type integrase/transposase/recombinase [Vibrio vulnificus]|nr:DDE-type integrase/transposase/recombinase [Vibrio vulnificus]
MTAIFYYRFLIWPIDRYCHHVHWHCKLGYGYTALKAWRWYNTAQAILTSLVLHSDNGSPMISYTMLAKMNDLGVMSSYSRPRVSNDNPYSESIFKTVKCIPS